MRSSFRLFRIGGIDIGIHYSWLFIFALVAWSLSASFFPLSYRGWSQSTYWLTGIIASLLLFVSVLLHELAHSFVAKARGLPVSSITLFLFGGVSNLQEEPRTSGVEFIMAIVGPLTSLALAAIFWLILASMPVKNPVTVSLYLTATTNNDPVAATLFYLAVINGALAVFNLLPAFPLDGGRVLRSILWGATHNLKRATNNAAGVGQAFGWGLIILGIFQLFSGNFVGGLWIAFIGWFLSNAAGASRQEVTFREQLKGIKVKDVMSASPESISPETSVEELVRGIFYQHHSRAVPVCRDNRPAGIATITDVKKIPQSKWAETPVEKIMTREPLYSVSPDDDLSSAMRLIAERDVNQVLVLRQDQCAGLLTRADIIQHLQFSQELGLGRKPEVKV